MSWNASPAMSYCACELTIDCKSSQNCPHHLRSLINDLCSVRCSTTCPDSRRQSIEPQNKRSCYCVGISRTSANDSLWLQVMMEFRNSDSRHVDWVKALKQVFQQLKAYVKQHHPTGPAWNAKGIPFKDFKPDSTGAAAPSPASAPKPPPAGERLCTRLLLQLACQV